MTVMIPNGEFSPEPNEVPKGWGCEIIYASNDLYCGKILQFDRAGAQFSLHFHKRKDETWYVLDGEFEVHYADPETGQIVVHPLMLGQIWRNWPCDVHRLKCVTPGRILEVSTADAESDNVRVAPGDSQVAVLTEPPIFPGPTVDTSATRYGLTCHDCGHRWNQGLVMRGGYQTIRCPHCSAIVTTEMWERRLVFTDDQARKPASEIHP